mmetsp:Transcript_81857/g.254052  ORF Transcript_81857/g.254052 Transcript_81857/m.254052 type:complete len:220 (+) Transcript_81857:491-1150(+)
MHVPVEKGANVTVVQAALAVPPGVHSAMDPVEVRDAPIQHGHCPQHEPRRLLRSEEAHAVRHTCDRFPMAHDQHLLHRRQQRRTQRPENIAAQLRPRGVLLVKLVRRELRLERREVQQPVPHARHERHEQQVAMHDGPHPARREAQVPASSGSLHVHRVPPHHDGDCDLGKLTAEDSDVVGKPVMVRPQLTARVGALLVALGLGGAVGVDEVVDVAQGP